MKLFMDSSTNYLYLALYSDKEINSFLRNGKNDHSETLVDVLDKFLKENNVTVDDITEIFVGRGPGSYTGVRISGTVAKVLALIKNKKLYSFSTLDLLLVSKINEDGLYMPRIVAKKNHSYFKLAKIENNNITFDKEDSFLIDDELLPFENYQYIEATDEVLLTSCLTETLIKHNLYKEEDIYNYVPNYLRSEING
jgi:tRNA threonylcarbamoyl adenosine modification protein YeaZ